MATPGGTISLAGQLILFLYLLIPGYVAFRAYIWANIALDRTTRLTKLVLMALGGFTSLAGIAFFRQIIFPGPVQWLLNFLSGLTQWTLDLVTGLAQGLPIPNFIFDFIQLLQNLFSGLAQWLLGLISNFTISGELSVTTISRLSILESTNLIISQSVIAMLGGILVGMIRYIFIDQDNPRRRYLEQPWEELADQVSRSDKITVITCSGDKITGEFEQIGNNPEDKDLLIRNPQMLDAGLTEASKLGEMSYHSKQDISRVIVYDQYLDGGRGWLNRQYMRMLQSLVDLEEDASNRILEFYSNLKSRPYSKEDDESNIDESVQIGKNKSDDGDGSETDEEGESETDESLTSTILNRLSDIKSNWIARLDGDDGGDPDGDERQPNG